MHIYWDSLVDLWINCDSLSLHSIGVLTTSKKKSEIINYYSNISKHDIPQRRNIWPTLGLYQPTLSNRSTLTSRGENTNQRKPYRNAGGGNIVITEKWFWSYVKGDVEIYWNKHQFHVYSHIRIMIKYTAIYLRKLLCCVIWRRGKEIPHACITSNFAARDGWGLTTWCSLVP